MYTNKSANRLIIPSGHNLRGLTISLEYSDDNITYSTAVTWTQPDSNRIDKSFDTQTKRFWRLNIASPSSPPELAEMFLGLTYEFENNPKYGLLEEKRRNIGHEETKSGYSRRIKFGEEREFRAYDLFVGDAQKTNLESWWNTIDSIKPFYVYDHNGTLVFMEILNDLSFVAIANGYWTVRLELLEVL